MSTIERWKQGDRSEGRQEMLVLASLITLTLQGIPLRNVRSCRYCRYRERYLRWQRDAVFVTFEEQLDKGQILKETCSSSLYSLSLLHMDATGLVGALQQDVIDQRAVADHLVILAKKLKSATAAGSNVERIRSVSVKAASPSYDVRPSSEDLSKSKQAYDDERHERSPTEGEILDAEEKVDLGQESAPSAQETLQPQAEAAGRQEPQIDNESKSAVGGDLLLELIQGFRVGMLRVDSSLRAAMFRAMRYLVRTIEDAEVIRKQRFGLFIALALAREQYDLWERMQALKLVKQIMAVDPSRLPREVVRTVVAVSGHKEDNFRRVCLETLRELAMADPRTVAHANGLRVLLAAAIDPATQDLVDPLITTLMSIVEDPSTRKFVRPHLDLHQLLSGFTDLDIPPGTERVHRWKATRKALVVAMRSWAGVHLLASDPRGLVALMRLLRDPSASFSEDAELQDEVMATLSALVLPVVANKCNYLRPDDSLVAVADGIFGMLARFNILDTIIDIYDPVMDMSNTTSLTDLGNKQRSASFVDKLFTPFSGGATTFAHKGTRSVFHMGASTEQHNLLLSYATMLCAAFVHCGLIPSLTTLGISASSEELREKAATLLVNILHLCAMLLSQNQCTRLLSMPGLVQIAAESQTGYMSSGKGGAQSCHLARSRASRASDLIRLLHGALGAGAGEPVPRYLGQQSQVEQSTCTIGGIVQKVHEANRIINKNDLRGREPWEPTGTLQQMRKELRLSLESTVKKSVMDTQMNKSKVLITKDWTKWDWDVIDDIIVDILFHPPRLVDALRTKWVKRVSGFYRFVGAGGADTSTDRGGGGGLHNIDWDPGNVRHVARAGRLFALLLQQPEGVHFLQTDARGGILQEIVKELQALVTRRWSSGGGAGRITNVSKVFDMESCQRRLSSGYITLLFSVAATSEAGRELLENTELKKHLQSMGCQPELDYMSRLILTRIDFSCKRFIARELVGGWMVSGSRHLRLFAVNLMRSVLRGVASADRDLKHRALETPAECYHADGGDSELELWCIETLVEQLNQEEPVIVRAVLSVLEEAAQDDRCLRALLLCKPDLINTPGATNLLVRLMSIPEGIQYLDRLGWVERTVREWKQSGRMAAYVENLDATWKAHVNEVEHVEDTLDMEPSAELGGSSGDAAAAVAIPIRTDDITSTQPETTVGELWDGHGLPLLLSLPWNIEVTLSRDQTPSAGLQLSLDTFVDPSPSEDYDSRTSAPGTLGSTTMVVRGILVDQAGKPTCHPLEAQLNLHARLCVGACAVDRWGNIQSHSTHAADMQAPPSWRHRASRISRSHWPPQSRRADHGVYGANTMYRGMQGMQDFGTVRDLPEDPSDTESQLFWSTCRPHERVAVPLVPTNPESESSTRPGSVGMRIRTISPLATALRDEEHGAELGGPASEDAKTRERINPRAHDRVVTITNETARWIFTDHPESQVVENTGVTYLKAVEFTISLKNIGPSAIILPPHLYGELAKTERGCELLRQHGDLKDLLHVARNSSAAADDRKGALWAVAHVSRWPLGLALLEELQENVVGMLLSMCTSESHLAVWGTSFSVMSLAARTARGRAAIRAAGWESARDPSTNVFLPQDPAILFQPVPWEYEGSLTQGLDEQQSDPAIESIWDNLTAHEHQNYRAGYSFVRMRHRHHVDFVHDRTEGQAEVVSQVEESNVLQQVAKLSSHISRKEAMKKLSRLRKDKTHRESFTNSLPVFLLVHQLLADYSFSLPMRRYISDLFDHVSPSSDWVPYVG